ncbi:cytochrome P450 [Xylaria arbuscula]|nr:cytochrome P450 [Xylaria arbuscula]
MAILGFVAPYFASVIVGYVCLVLSFRVSWHPLRKYPGPLIAKLTDAYGGFFAVRGSLHVETYKNHLKYGPVVRPAPDRLVFNTAQAFQDIYQNERIQKSHLYQDARIDENNIFTTINKNQHRPKRRLISQLLSDQSTRDFEPTIIGAIDVFLRQLKAADSRPVNMTLNCRYFGLEVAGLLGFGYNLNLQTNETDRYLTRAISFGMHAYSIGVQYVPFAQLKIPAIMGLFPSSLRAKNLATLSKMITTRLAEPMDARHDLLSIFNSPSDTDIGNLRQGELWAEAKFFFIASGETVATTLTAAFFYLSRNPQCYKRLSAEIRSTFGSSAEIRVGTRLSACRYLRACIDETLRMSPPVPTTLWREAVPDAKSEPLIVDGHVIPPGTQIGVNVYSLHHNERYFPEPFRFVPDRWLDGDETKLTAYQAFAPFSTGTRGCLGKTMAYLEVSLVLATTLWYFDFEPAPHGNGSEKTLGVAYETGEFPMYDHFAADHNGPSLVFRPRGSYCEELRSET